MSVRATYQIFIDWDNDGGLNAGDFESGLDDWVATGTIPPEISQSAAQFHSGKLSLRIPWQPYNPMRFDVAGTGFDQGRFGGSFSSTAGAFKFGTVGRGFDDGRFSESGATDPTVTNPRVQRIWQGLVPGREYTYSAWVYVPAGSPAVRLAVAGVALSAANSVFDGWVQIALPFVAVAAEHVLQVEPAGVFLSEGEAWLDQVQILGPGEDVSLRSLGLRTPLEMEYGRDIARSLSAIRPGGMSLELNNISRDYSPDNPGSPLYGYLSPGKPVLVRGTFEGKSYTLFRGFLDGYEIIPDKGQRSVRFTVRDFLGSKLGATTVSTALYPSVQTGEAVHRVLDALGWPEADRDIDPGASTIRYWWEQDATGLDAVTRIAAAEGPPAFAFIDPSGKMVFRDRHHRIMRPESLASQAVFRDELIEPTFCAPMTYDIGWRDLVNSIDISVEERQAESGRTRVFESEDTVSLGTGETRILRAVTSEPFLGALTPVAGVDYTVRSGAVSVSLSRDSGQVIEISLTATSAAVLAGMAVRAFSVPVARTWQIHVEDPGSIERNGPRSPDTDIPWVGVHDALAIGTILVGQRSERLPVVTITLNGGRAARLREILSRDLSDRVRIIEGETFTDHEFFIEQISHTVNQVGYDHRAEFGCERIRTQVVPLFTFDDPAAGFNKGLFGLAGFDEQGSVFVLDQSSLDEGLLGH